MLALEKTQVNLKIKKLAHSVSEPFYATEGSAGMDLCAAIDQPLSINPMGRCAIPTGLIFEVPMGYEAQVRARSGLSINHGLCLANGIGTIDSDYRGEVKVLMINLGAKSYTVNPGDRVAQVVICPVMKADLEIVTEVAETDRNSGGFGSTGV